MASLKSELASNMSAGFSKWKNIAGNHGVDLLEVLPKGKGQRECDLLTSPNKAATLQKIMEVFDEKHADSKKAFEYIRNPLGATSAPK